MTTRNLACAVCGADAGRFEQHWNRDTGFGVCPLCVAMEAGRETTEDLERLYGKPGVNYEAPTIVHYGRRFSVLAAFRDDERGHERANAFMGRRPEAALLTLVDGIAYLASVSDKGVPV